MMLDMTVFDFIDPRGRADRRGLALLAAVFLAAEVLYAGVFALISPLVGDGPHTAGLVIHSFALWVAIAGTAKRLHDMGRTLWCFAAFMAIWLVWTAAIAFATVFWLGPDAVAQDLKGLMLASALSMLPALAALCWLHFAPGEVGPNRFGPAPDVSGFAHPHQDIATPAAR